MGEIKKIPLELKGLWNFQYKPREEYLKKILSKDALKLYLTFSYTKKIIVIDNLQQKGFFE